MHYLTQIQDTSRRLCQHQHGTIPLMHYPTLIQDTSRREPAPTRDYPTICTISPKFRTPRDACASTNTGLSHYVHYPTQIQDTSRRLCQHLPGTIPLYALSHPNSGHLETPVPAPTRDYPTMCTIPPKYRTPRGACASTHPGLHLYPTICTIPPKYRTPSSPTRYYLQQHII
jgi:hypothetical protein